MSSLRIAENIMHLRKQKGITQDELASFLGGFRIQMGKWAEYAGYYTSAGNSNLF